MCLWDRKVTLTLISHMKWYTIIQFFFFSNNSGNFQHSIPCLQRKYKNTISVSYWLFHAIFFQLFLHIGVCWNWNSVLRKNRAKRTHSLFMAAFISAPIPKYVYKKFVNEKTWYQSSIKCENQTIISLILFSFTSIHNTHHERAVDVSCWYWAYSSVRMTLFKPTKLVKIFSKKKLMKKMLKFQTQLFVRF